MKGVRGHGILQRNLNKLSFASFIGTNTIGNKEDSVGSPVGVKYVGVEGSGPVYMTGRVKIESPKR